jgi:cytochrome c oxidase subunit 1
LPFLSSGAWETWSLVLFLLAVLIIAVELLVIDIEFLWRGRRHYGSLSRMYGLEYLTDPHPKDDGRPRTDLATIAMTTTSLTWIPAAILGVALVMLQLAQVVVPTFSFSALLAKNLTFFFGHMLVNVSLYMGAGLVYAILPAYAKRPWKVARYAVIGWLATTMALWFAFYHHLYQDFAQPDAVQVVGQVFSYISAVPALVVSILGGVMLVWRSGIRWSTAPIYLYAGLAGWAIAGAGAIIDGTDALNQYMHNTLWVAGHFHGFMAMGVMMFFLGTLYHAFPKAAGGRRLSETIGRRAALLVVTGGYVVIGSFFLSGVVSEPRRYAVQLPGTEWLAAMGLLGAILVGAGGLLIIGDLARTLMRPVGPPDAVVHTPSAGRRSRIPRPAYGLVAALLFVVVGVALSLGVGGTTGDVTVAGVASALNGPAAVSARDIRFDVSTIQAPADRGFQIDFTNADSVPHNIAIYTSASATETRFRGDIVTGPIMVRYDAPALSAGSYYFQCDIHASMNGTVISR